MALTDKQLKAFQGIGKPQRILDEKNLYILVNATGTSKSWQFRYRRPTDNKADIYSIGRYPDISLQEAREKADTLRKLINNGIDPKQNDKAQQQAKIEELNKINHTFKNIALEWFDGHKPTIGKKRIVKINGMLENHLFPEIGQVNINDLTGEELLKAIQKIEKKGVTTIPKNCMSLAGQIFGYAIATGKMAHSIDTKRLSTYLKKHKVKHHPHIKKEEIPHLMQSLELIKGNPITLLALKLVILLHPRQGAFRQCKWEYIDWATNTLTIPSHLMKGLKLQKESGDLEHTIPLPIQAVKLLEQLRQFTGNNPSGFLFPSRIGNGKVMSDGTLNKALKQVISSKKQDIHGFRGLASTCLNDKHPDKKAVINAMLAHKDKDDDDTEKAYNHAKYFDHKQELWQEWADFLESQGLKI